MTKEDFGQYKIGNVLNVELDYFGKPITRTGIFEGFYGDNVKLSGAIYPLGKVRKISKV